MGYNNVIEKIGTATDAAGVAVLVAGGLIAFGLAAVHLSRGDPDVYRRFRQRLGQTILLGLELLVAGDIVRTVATSPSLTSVAILTAIVIFRTFLSFSLEVEIAGRWPWQKPEPATAPTTASPPTAAKAPSPSSPANAFEGAAPFVAARHDHRRASGGESLSPQRDRRRSRTRPQPRGAREPGPQRRPRSS